jgi:hypothetical protein
MEFALPFGVTHGPDQRRGRSRLLVPSAFGVQNSAFDVSVAVLPRKRKPGGMRYLVGLLIFSRPPFLRMTKSQRPSRKPVP